MMRQRIAELAAGLGIVLPIFGILTGEGFVASFQFFIFFFVIFVIVKPRN
jgi:hypothetical protein